MNLLLAVGSVLIGVITVVTTPGRLQAVTGMSGTLARCLHPLTWLAIAVSFALRWWAPAAGFAADALALVGLASYLLFVALLVGLTRGTSHQ